MRALKLYIVSILSFMMFSSVCMAEGNWWSKTTETISSNAETISEVSEVLSGLSKTLGGSGGVIASSIFALIATFFANMARVQKNKRLSAEEKRELVTKALKATVDAIDAYKGEAKSSESAGSFSEVERVNAILKAYQEKAGSDVVNTVKVVRESTNEGQESK